MGDRANVFVVDPYASTDDEYAGVYLYTHLDGRALPKTLANALDSNDGRDRWDDGAYLTRIIFDHMTGLTGGSSGFGISSSIGDNSYPILVVNPNTKQVSMIGEGQERNKHATALRIWTFEQFIALRPSW